MKIQIIILGIIVAVCDLASSAEQPSVQLPDGVKAVWDIDKAERKATQTRETICINGLWNWQPAQNDEVAPPTENRGWFKVPGSWPGITDYMQKDSQTVYTHPNWKNTKLSDVKKAWYQREIEIPKSWVGRRIILKADYVNSRAVVYVDAEKIGEILFPGGEIDLSTVCVPGSKHVLSMEVSAIPLADVIAIFGDTNAPRQGNATVARRGLCGDVFLVSEPIGAKIKDVKAETSVREKKITIHTKLENLDPNTRYMLRFSFSTGNFDSKMMLYNAFYGRDAKNGCISTAKNDVDLNNLWDIHSPQNMYEVVVSLTEWVPPEMLDEPVVSYDTTFPVRFGFREFWIEGRDLYLNGSRIWLSCVPFDNAQIGAALANYDAAKESMLRLKSFGVNFVYTHNYDCNPGSFVSFAEILRAADDVGMLVSFSQPHFGHFDWDAEDADAKNGYAQVAEFLVNEAKNHPSVVFYSMSHNATGYAEDMNPDLMDGVSAPRSRWAVNNLKKAERAAEIVQKLDSDRIVYHHASGNLGPMHNSNFYINFVPVQEMSDWFGYWAKNGVKPLFTCEYGVPFTWDWAMYRGWYDGKREFGSASVPWEFCNAEWNSQFLGDTAFRIGEPEKKNLRWEANQFHDGKLWKRWDYPHALGSKDFTDQDVVFERYITDNWRAFRTWGLSINSFWEHGRLWKLKPGVNKSRNDYAIDWETLQRPGFSPDFQDQRYERIDIAFDRVDWIESAGAKSLLHNNMPLLGYVAGKNDAFTGKNHNFLPGDTIEKQFVAINNSRQSIDCLCQYSINPPWKGIENLVYDQTNFKLETGNIKQIPFQIQLPNDLASGTYEIEASFRFSDSDDVDLDFQKDKFSIHVLPKPESVPDMKIALFDPKGNTAKLLDDSGVKYKTIQKESEAVDCDMLIFGKESLDSKKNEFNLENVQKGLKVIVFEQTTETLEKRFGFRTTEYGLRQVFKRIPDHPVLNGLETDNLRDWAGEATLLPPRLKYETNDQVFNGVPTVQWNGVTVPRVWRCGNRGNVASVLIEKPARGDYLPILDGGFSLQYSPLIEYRRGNGMIMFCQMDVIGRTETDPAAKTLFVNLVRYAKDWKPEPKRKIFYLGNDTAKDFLENCSVYFTENLAAANLLVLGPGCGNSVSSDTLNMIKKFRNEGKTVAFGLSAEDLKIVLPDILVNNAEHISSYFEPQGMVSPFRGIGPADIHNRDPKNYPLVSGGATIIGDGILAVTDNGNTVICGLAPWQFDAGKQSFKRTFRRTAFLVSRLLNNMNVETVPTQGLYFDQPEEWDDPYRFFRW